MEKIDLSSLTFEELSEALKSLSLPAFRAGQIYRWISRGVSSFDAMSDLSKDLRETLAQTFSLAQVYEETCLVSSDGTKKFLFRLADGNHIETVLMRYEHGNSVCISSQVGCSMGCRFCASTLKGKVRDLTAGEMFAQIAYINRTDPVSHVVVMGVGEPLDNFDNLVTFVRNLSSPKGFGMSQRHISVSTCGLVPKIDRLAELNLQITLSVSLHAPDNETRDRIMPVNKAYPVEKLLAACDRYTAATGRRISYEYIMIRGVNDTPRHAQLLAKHLHRKLAHVNLIPMNHVDERDFQPSTPDAIRRFTAILTEQGINATCRRKLGKDIDASCGQLRARFEKNNPTR
ncbi:MAG: 23S rRNA (adenine(2503)-C(2))-methyltransferase RlmN [Clostridia bacterium]|nr:23S rRNA (adenine(2503)-C(2))-methyltransferase RlmN [Clostridia bacterium]MBQ4324091.1 23S rRNA (adenine(2503)-C(2))-methyltransferase RlmN [Clostridia bacterium]